MTARAGPAGRAAAAAVLLAQVAGVALGALVHGAGSLRPWSSDGGLGAGRDGVAPAPASLPPAVAAPFLPAGACEQFPQARQRASSPLRL